MKSWSCRSIASLTLWGLLSALTIAADEPIAPEKAKDFADKTVTVKMAVKSGRDLLAEKQELIYLNSEADFKSKTNLALVIHKKAADEMKKAGINDPYLHFKGETVKATGKVKVKDDVAKLHIDEAKQIELADQK